MTTMRIYCCLMTLFTAFVSGQNVMTVSMPSNNNWNIGMTMDSNFGKKPSPFTYESLQEFQSAWREKKENGNYERLETFDITSRLAQSEAEKLKAIGVERSMDTRFMCFSVCSWT